MHIAKFSVKNPVFVNLIMVTVFVLGTVALMDLPRQLMPNVNFHWVYVVTTYDGVSPEDIESLITIPLEEAVDKIDKIKMFTSSSSEGVSMISIQFENMKEDEYNKLYQDLKSEIDKVDDLPDEVDGPNYLEFGSDDLVPMLTMLISGTLPEREMKQIAEDLQTDVLAINHIARAELGGVRDREIWVDVDPDRLNSYNIALSHVVNSIAMKNLNIPGGTMKVGRSEYILRTVGEFDKVEDLENVIIRMNAREGNVRVSDIAAVIDTLEKAENLSRLDGNKAITMTIAKNPDGNVLHLVKEIREMAEKKQANLPESVRISFTNDMAIPVTDVLNVLQSNAIIGLLMVLIILWVFIGWRNALITAIGIPVTFLATFIFLYITDRSLNGTSLFGLVLVLGIIVDDAIIVIENCYRYIQKGYSPVKAAIIGTREVTVPVLSATATTVAAFLPLMLVPGIIGEFFKVMPIVVTLALVASLFEVFFILPAHISEWSSRVYLAGQVRDKVFLRIRSKYRKMLKRLLRKRYFAITAVILLVFICAALVVVHIGIDMFAGDEIPMFFVRVMMPEGTRLEETDRIMRQLEREAMTLPRPDVKAVVTNTGVMQTDTDWYLKPNVGQLTIELVEAKYRDRNVASFIDELRAKTGDVSGIKSIEFTGVNSGPPIGPPIEIKIRGNNFDVLQIIAEEVKTVLGSIEGVSDIRDNFDYGKKELKIKVNEERSAMHGLDIFQIASTVRTAFDGTVATKYRDNDEEVEVIVKFADGSANSIEDLENIKISTPFNNIIPLKDIAEFSLAPGYTSIQRTDGERTITVTADVDQSKANATAINRKIMDDFSNLGARHPGYSLSFGGEFAEFAETMEGLWKLFILGIFLIYIILGGQFSSFIQPLIIFFTIPFAFIGAIAGLLIIDSPFTIATMYGIVALAGIVVNDALVLISFINNARQSGLSRWRSILSAGSVRLRPIILTSVTTIFGLLPMAIGLGGKSDTWAPLATIIVGGLFFSTVFTLFIIPCLVAAVDDIKFFFGAKSLKPRMHLDEIEAVA